MKHDVHRTCIEYSSRLSGDVCSITGTLIVRDELKARLFGPSADVTAVLTADARHGTDITDTERHE